MDTYDTLPVIAFKTTATITNTNTMSTSANPTNKDTGFIRAMENALAATIMTKTITGAASGHIGNKNTAAEDARGIRARVVGGSRRGIPRRTLKRKQRRKKLQEQQQQPRRVSTAAIADTSASSFARANGQPTDILGMKTGIDYEEEQDMQLDTPRAFGGSPSKNQSCHNIIYKQQAKNHGLTNATSRRRGALKQPQRRSQNH